MEIEQVKFGVGDEVFTLRAVGKQRAKITRERIYGVSYRYADGELSLRGYLLFDDDNTLPPQFVFATLDEAVEAAENAMAAERAKKDDGDVPSIKELVDMFSAAAAELGAEVHVCEAKGE